MCAIYFQGNFVSVMVWEITLLPSLRWDTWLHHLFLILGVTFATDHNLRQAYTYVITSRGLGFSKWRKRT